MSHPGFTEVTTRHDEQATRRQIMRAGLAGGGVVAASARAQAKITHAQYQPTPKDGNKCSPCVNFAPPVARNIVAGTISPNGRCVASAPREPTEGSITPAESRRPDLK